MRKALALFTCLLSMVLAQAGTGKPCGNSYINQFYTCHKDTASTADTYSTPYYFQQPVSGVMQRETVTMPASFQPITTVTPAMVIQIMDGASFMSYVNYQPARLHFAGIKVAVMSPELTQQVNQYLIRLMPASSSVLVEFASNQEVYVWLMGDLVNLALIEHGYAHLDASTKGPYDGVLANGLKYAQDKKLGLWAAPQAP